MSAAANILEAIPHRPPFLFLDQILEKNENRLLARKYVDPSETFFQGHYPGRPVMPGVLLCECCFQAGAVLASESLGGQQDPEGVPVLTRINEARFRRIVIPGECLLIEVVLNDRIDNAFYFTGRVRVGDELAVQVSFACMLASVAEAPR